MPSSEEVVDRLIEALVRAGAVPDTPGTPWPEFGRVSRAIHGTFEVPASTMTPIMRRLLFAVGFATNARRVAGIGSYAGYLLGFLAAGASARAEGVDVVGLDPDRLANQLARRNLARLPGFADVNVIDGSSPEDLDLVVGGPELVLLDLDHPSTGKRGYADALPWLAEHLPTGAVIAAHDACVPRFSEDFAAFAEAVRICPRLNGPWTLPVDECGLSLVRVA